MSIMPRTACSVRNADFEAVDFDAADFDEHVEAPAPLFQDGARHLFDVISERLHSHVSYEEYNNYYNLWARYHMRDIPISDIMERFITHSTRHITLRRFLHAKGCPYTPDIMKMYTNWLQHRIFENTNRWQRMEQFWEEYEFLLPRV
jgi:hypothetical protein